MDFGMGMLGLGAMSDLFGAYSAYSQQQQQKDLYKKQLEIRNQLMNPAAMVAGAQPYTAYLNKNLATQIPNIIRSSVAPQMGMSGVDPSGGQGQLILDQALAPYYANNAQTGLQQYMNALNAASGVGGTATQNVGAQFGGSGGLMEGLKTLMLMNALRGGGGGVAGAGGGGGVAGAGGGSDNFGFGNLSQYTAPNFGFGNMAQFSPTGGATSPSPFTRTGAPGEV